MEPIIGATAPSPPPADLIKESDTASFAQDVIEGSMKTPVIVDFWAPWCGPCKQLGPLLEKAVTAARGAVRMVKVNIDENQELAAQLRIQSIPTVYAFSQGRPVDGFQGALPESQIKSFVERLVRAVGGTAEAGDDPVAEALDQAEAALEQGQAGAASTIFGQVLQHDPENLRALAGMARAQLAAGDVEGAQQLLDGLTDELRGKPELVSAAAALELAAAGAAAGDEAELRGRLAANPKDHQARFDLAMALYARERREDAAEALLDIIQSDRQWTEEAARKQLVKFFEAWGQTDPATLAARRRLSSLLFS